jgi:hypothetical protein
MAEPPKELLGFLEPYSCGIQELTLALRQLVIEETAPCCEYILEVYCVSLLYGPTHKIKDGYLDGEITVQVNRPGQEYRSSSIHR